MSYLIRLRPANRRRNLILSILLYAVVCAMPVHALTASFSSSSVSGPVSSPVSVASADFNSDGKADLAILDSGGTVTILKGDGNGTFQTAGSFNAGSNMISIAAGTFNNNVTGKSDLALLDDTGTEVHFHYNNNGSFSSNPDKNISVNAVRSIKGINTGQSMLSDLLLVDQNGQLTIASGLSNWTSSNQLTVSSGATTTAASTGKLNGDTIDDLVTINGTGAVSFFPGASASSFGGPYPLASSSSFKDLAIGDFTGNGRNDIIIVNQGSGNLTMLTNITAPPWSPGYPKAGDISATAASLLVKTDDSSYVFLACLPVGSPAPTVQQIRNGLDASGNFLPYNLNNSMFLSAATESPISCTNLSGGTSYVLYAVASADQTSPYLQTSPATFGIVTLPEAPVVSIIFVTPTTFTATWNAVTGAAGYLLDVSQNFNFSTVVGSYSNVDTGTATSLMISGLSPNSAYYVRVRAYLAGGTTGQFSTNGNGSTLPLPAPPTIQTATNITPNGFTANWGAVQYATGYFLDVSTDAGFTSFTDTFNNKDVGTQTTFTVSGLSGNTTYYYRVRASFTGTSGSSSSPASTTTLLPVPDAPAAPVLTPNWQNTGFMVIWETVTYAAGYRVDVATDAGFSAMVNGFSNYDMGSANGMTVANLSPGSTYYVRIRAYNTTGTGSNSASTSLTLAPSAPFSRPATSVSTSGFLAVWDAVPGATGYRLDVAVDPQFTSFLHSYASRDVGNVLSFPVSGTAPGVSYHYRVQAYNSGGSSSNSRSIYISVPGLPQVSLAAPRVFPTGSGPSASVTADFNGDGIPDVAVSNQSENSISIYIGIGDGSFRAPISLPCGAGPTRIRAVDMNQDGKIDLVTANNYGASISLFLGNGDGTFQDAATTSVGDYPTDIVTGDFNGDGNLDLALTNGYSNTIRILPGKGNGTFAAQSIIPSNNLTRNLTSADFNNDGILDLAGSTSGNSYRVMLGNGDGTFQSEKFYTVPGETSYIESADLNGDGNVDLAIITLDRSDPQNVAGSLRVLLGKGDGSFTEQAPHACGTLPQALRIADLNNDHIPDILISTYTGNSLMMLYGTGSGDFTNSGYLSVPKLTSSIVVADFDENGLKDIGLVSFSHSLFTVFYQSANGTFAGAAKSFFQQPMLANSLVTGDFNKDGKTDVAWSVMVDGVAQTGAVSAFYGDGSGALTSRTDAVLNRVPGASLAVDLNKDGISDIVATGTGSSMISVVLGGQNSTLQTPAYYGVTGAQDRATSGDFNGDGIPDLAVADTYAHAVSILLGNGDGTFMARTDYPAGLYPQDITADDFNGDGKTDLVIADSDPNAFGVQVLLGNGAGGFSAPVRYPVRSRAYFVTTGDFNHDGTRDLAVSNRDAGSVSILLGNGDGTFQPAKDYPAGAIPLQIITVDLNRDGFDDLVTANGNGYVSVLSGKGDGTFAAPSYFWTGGSTTVAAGSFTASGLTDLAIVNHIGGGVALLLNKALPEFAPTYPRAVATSSSSSQVIVKSTLGGNAYAVCLPAGSTPPTAAQIKAGQNAAGSSLAAGQMGTTALSAHVAAPILMSSLSAGTAYDVYVIIEDGQQHIQPVPGVVSFVQAQDISLQQLTLVITGYGMVNSSSATAVGAPQDISLCQDSCSAAYPTGSVVDLYSWSNAYYADITWGGADSSNGRSATVTLDTARSVVVTYSNPDNLQLSNPSGFRSSIVQAFRDAADGATIKAKSMYFPQQLMLTDYKTYTLIGGWQQLGDPFPTGVTSIYNLISISAGRLNIRGSVKIVP